MKKLIEALNIFLKYEDKEYPTACSNEELIVFVDPDKVSEEDKIKLEELGFLIYQGQNCFYSYRYGSN